MTTMARSIAPSLGAAFSNRIGRSPILTTTRLLTKDEYLNYVEMVFKRADTDGDGTLDAKEVRTHAGRVLMRLLRPR